jgi:hypothetical protein
MIEFLNLRHINGYPTPISILGIASNARTRAAVNTYSGRTFIFYDTYCMEIDECQFIAKSYGFFSKDFPVSDQA